MTTKEYLLARQSKDWKFNTIVGKNDFLSVNKIHPIKQKMVKQIVSAAQKDPCVKRVIIFGSSTRYDCDITSDLDICIDWTADCYDQDGVLKPFTRNMREHISRITGGNADVVNRDYLAETDVEQAVKEGVVVYEYDV